MFYSKIFSHCPPPPHTPKQDYSNKEMYENQDSSAQHYYSFYSPKTNWKMKTYLLLVAMGILYCLLMY